MVNIYINGQHYVAPEGLSVLDACRRYGYHVPALCYHPRLKPLGRCKVCVVELEDSGNLCISCSTQIEEGMKIRTDTPRVISKATQAMRGLKEKQTERMTRVVADKTEFDRLCQWADGSELHKNAAVTIDPTLCVECGRCEEACSRLQDMHILEIPNGQPVRATGGVAFDTSACIGCGQCSTFCPTGAINATSHIDKIYDAIAAGDKTIVAQTAPSIRVALGEECGVPAGEITTGKMVAALRAIGFKHVFDTNYSADLTILEEGTELIGRLSKKWAGEEVAMPMFTSCCPAWINSVEQDFPEFIPNLSSCKSPMMMLGRIVKQYWAEKAGIDRSKIFQVAIMPCTAKKMEIER
ncbi:NADPH fad oxidoreductase, putative, partial [Aduncisulcus paluster]